MSTTNVNFKMDTELKKQMESLCQELGMNMTTAFTIFAKKMCRERRIPFEITADTDSFYSEENVARILMAVQNLNEGKKVYRDLIEDE